MNNIENRAREYLAEHSEYSEVFGQTFVAVDTLTAMVEFAKQETKNFEKENAELRLKLEALEGQTPWKDIKDKSEVIEKLTKATELLRFWVNNFYDSFNNLNRYEERHKALKQSEQFLSEVEK